ncbi:MAG: hypothetical protein R3C49_00850 [Planctomycetaceae bacterium]
MQAACRIEPNEHIGIEPDDGRLLVTLLKKKTASLYSLAMLTHRDLPVLMGFCRYEPHVFERLVYELPIPVNYLTFSRRDWIFRGPDSSPESHAQVSSVK